MDRDRDFLEGTWVYDHSTGGRVEIVDSGVFQICPATKMPMNVPFSSLSPPRSIQSPDFNTEVYGKLAAAAAASEARVKAAKAEAEARVAAKAEAEARVRAKAEAKAKFKAASKVPRRKKPKKVAEPAEPSKAAEPAEPSKPAEPAEPSNPATNKERAAEEPAPISKEVAGGRKFSRKRKSASSKKQAKNSNVKNLGVGKPKSEILDQSPCPEEDDDGVKPFDALLHWEKELPSDVKRFPLVHKWTGWEDYYRVMHDTQGFGIKEAPDESFKATILPFYYEKVKTISPEMSAIFKDRSTISAKLSAMAEKCITFYNDHNSRMQKFNYKKIDHVTYSRKRSYSLYYITFKASPIDGSTNQETFFGQYHVIHDRSNGSSSGNVDEDEDDDETNETGGGATFCIMESEFDNIWKSDEPCSLSCCARYNMYPVKSNTYCDYARKLFKMHREVGTKWEFRAPSWFLAVLQGN